MVIEVTNVKWNVREARRAIVELVDTAGNELRLVDYEGAELTVDWTPHHRYRISHCRVRTGGDGHDLELAPSTRTVIESLGLAHGSTTLLVIGDTHIGRTKHPKTKEEIDPLGAFISATEYAIDREVDAVIHVGDIFHDNATLLHATLARQEAFEPLADAEIPFYYVRGNHAAKPGDELLEDLDGCTTFHLDTAGATVGSEVRLFGVDHYPASEFPWKELAFPGTVYKSTSVLVLHQTLDQLPGPKSNQIELGRIQRHFNGQFDLVVSGHHHDAVRRSWNGVPVMYAGAVERMSKNKDPTERVAWLLTAKNGAVSCERWDIPE